jgi:hypothetical protein
MRNRLTGLLVSGLAALILLSVPVHAQEDDSFCWKRNYGRGAGSVGNSCPSGSTMQDGLCYPTCPSGYTGAGPLCWQGCPSGYTDIGVSCQKPPAATCEGHGWQLGDSPTWPLEGWGNGARGRCEREHGRGCYESGGLFYPHCPDGFTRITNNICSPGCPNGMRDDGAYCAKNTTERGVGTVPTCGSGKQSDAGLCYPACGSGFTGIGPTCWGQCPADFPAQCGAACAKSDAACAIAIGDMALNTAGVALNVLGMAFGGPGITTAAKTAAKAATSAAGEAVLKSSARSWQGLLFASARRYAATYSKEFVKTTLKNKVTGPNKYWTMASLGKAGSIFAMNTAATEFGVLKDSNTFDLSMLTALDPTGVSSMVMSFTKYGACGGEELLVSSRELNYGRIGNNRIMQSFVVTAQEPMTVTRIATPAFSNCTIVPESDCVGKQLARGESCKVTVDVSTGGAALDAEVRLYTTSFSTIPYAVHVLANTGAAATCRELPNVEEAVNLTSVAGVWAFNNNQAQKVIVQSTGAAQAWAGGPGTVTVNDPAGRGFFFNFGLFGSAYLYLDELGESLISITAPEAGPIVAQHSGKALDVPGASTSDGVALIQWDQHGGANQTFRFDALEPGTYKIVASHSGKVLTVQGASLASGAKIVQSTWTGADSQRFRLEPLEGSYFRIINVNSNKALNVAGGYYNSGAEIIQWDRTGGGNEKFRLSSTQSVRAVRRPWGAGCAAGQTLFEGLCYDVPPGRAMTTPGIMGNPCPYDWRDDGTSCYPPWKGVKVDSQADPNGSFTMRHPIIVTDCWNYSQARGQSCPANFKNTGGPGGCSCEAQPMSKYIAPILASVPK